jgi:hypothetical protein
LHREILGIKIGYALKMQHKQVLTKEIEEFVESKSKQSLTSL